MMIRRIFIFLSMGLILSGLFGTDAFAGKIKEGDAFPHFTATDIEGKAVDTKAQFSDRVLLIDFWSIYCSSCIQEMPHLVDLYNRYNEKGLSVAGINLDTGGPKRVLKFMKTLKFTVPYPTVIDGKKQVMRLLGVSILPTTILVDASGTIRLYHVGYKPGFEKELEEMVLEILP